MQNVDDFEVFISDFQALEPLIDLFSLSNPTGLNGQHQPLQAYFIKTQISLTQDIRTI